MHHVGIILKVLIKVHLHVVAVAAEVVACQIDKHHMFSILLGVVAQIFRSLAVGLSITSALGCSRNRVDICLAPLDAAVSLG